MILRVWCTSHVQPRALSLLPLSARMVDVWFFSLLLLLLLCLHVVAVAVAASAVSSSALSLAQSSLTPRCSLVVATLLSCMEFFALCYFSA